MPPVLNSNSPKIERDALGRILPGQGGLPGAGRPKGSISIKDKVRQYLEDNPESLKEMVKELVEKEKKLVWQMLDGMPGQKMEHSGPNDTPLIPDTKVISEVAKKLNEVLGTGGVGSDGNIAGAVDSETPNKDV